MSLDQELTLAEGDPETGTEEPIRLIVGEEAGGTRLDTWLASQILTTSRTQLRRAIEAGKVLVDDQPVDKPAYAVRPGEFVRLTIVPVAPLEAKPSPIPLDIVYEDEAILVLHKPAGMVTHPGAGVADGTLANGLVYYFQQQQMALPRRGGPSRPGIVHRLDVGTSGLLVVARTDLAHLRLAEQFQSRQVRKRYAALVHGVVEESSGRIEVPIGRDPRSRVRMAVRPAGEGREALTFYHVTERLAEFTRLDVEIKTGKLEIGRAHV